MGRTGEGQDDRRGEEIRENKMIWGRGDDHFTKAGGSGSSEWDVNIESLLGKEFPLCVIYLIRSNERHEDCGCLTNWVIGSMIREGMEAQE